jgi:hypothetical protein
LIFVVLLPEREVADVARAQLRACRTRQGIEFRSRPIRHFFAVRLPAPCQNLILIAVSPPWKNLPTSV